MIMVPFDLDDIVKLLIGDREERFEFERAIRLQEFRTWIYWPRKGRFSAAGRVAAVFILDSIEEDIFFDEASAAHAEIDPGSPAFVDLTDKPAATLHRISVLRANKQYRQLYDRILADRGGLTGLLYCPSPTEFDAELLKRREKAVIVNDLVDYRLRYARHIGDGGGNITQAVFFKWWPTHDVPGRRGATSENKSPSPKTLFHWWSEFERSAIFIYLNELHGYSQIPEFGDVKLDGIKPLLDAANDTDT